MAACLVTSEPLPIATPTSACLSAAASLTASPVIATTSPGLLHQPGEAHLVLGSDATEHVQLRQRRDHFLVGHLVELGARLDARAEPEFIGDRPSGDRVVAGDHADVDPGGERPRDGVLRLGAQRVDDADERHEQQIVDGAHRVADRGGHRVVVQITHGERQHAQALLGQAPVRREQVVASSSIGTCSPCQARACTDRAPCPAHPSRS